MRIFKEFCGKNKKNSEFRSFFIDTQIEMGIFSQNGKVR